MSREMIDGVWVIKCDFTDEGGGPCDLGVNGEPAMFVDPTGGKDPDEHFQCGKHHGIVKQENNPDFQVPEDHKLTNQETELTKETTLIKEKGYIAPDKIELEGFKPNAGGRVWDGANVKR